MPVLFTGSEPAIPHSLQAVETQPSPRPPTQAVASMERHFTPVPPPRTPPAQEAKVQQFRKVLKEGFADLAHRLLSEFESQIEDYGEGSSLALKHGEYEEVVPTPVFNDIAPKTPTTCIDYQDRLPSRSKRGLSERIGKSCGDVGQDPEKWNESSPLSSASLADMQDLRVSRRSTTSDCEQPKSVLKSISRGTGGSFFSSGEKNQKKTKFDESLLECSRDESQEPDEKQSVATYEPDEKQSVATHVPNKGRLLNSMLEDEQAKRRTTIHAPHRIGQFLATAAGFGDGDETNANTLLVCDVLSSLVICCNLAITGWQLQHHYVEGSQLETGTSTDLTFCIIFVVELMCRFYLERKNGFFFGVNFGWNWFDFAVVIMMVVEEVLARVDGYQGHNLTVVRTTRFLRLIKIIRAVKLLRVLTFFRSGRLFIMTIVKASSLLFWVGLICFVMSYIFALIIAGRTLDECAGSPIPGNDLLCTHFGSVWMSCSSMYQAMLGGLRWGILLKAVQSLETHYVVSFLVYMTFLYCVVFQIVIGVFVVQVMKQNDVENLDAAIEERQKQEQQFLLKLVNFFKRLDVNSNGTLCLNEVVEMFMNKDMVALMGHNDLDVGSAEALFRLLDYDNSGEVDLEEFVEGCVRLRGQARAVDLERLRQDVKGLGNSMRKLSASLLGNGENSKSLNMYNSESEKDAATQSISASQSFRKPVLASSKSNAVFTQAQSLKAKLFRRQKSSPVRSTIKKTEMRAMSISELKEVLNIINTECILDNWTDPHSGEMLTPESTNLYHFNYFVISPQTAAPSIVLSGLKPCYYPEGGFIKQHDSRTGKLMAEAEILNKSDGPDVEIKILRGQFFPHHPVAMEYGENCGEPDRILSGGTSISYKELVAPSPTKPDWFVSHWWGEMISDFVLCCQEHSTGRQKDKYWVCAYANRQHELSNDINDDPEETSFRKAMALAEGVLLVLDSNATPFQRIWCDFELYKTIHGNKMLDIVTVSKNKAHLLTETPFVNEAAIIKTRREATFPLQVLFKGLEVQLEKGSATMEQDKINILNSMGKDPRTGKVDEDLLQGNVDMANKSLRGYFALAAWPQALQRGLVRRFAFDGTSNALRLANILQADKERKYVHLSLSGLDEMNDKEMQSLAEGLPPSLAHLNLSFENCSNISDGGVSYLSDRIVALPLHKLELFFTSCERLTDASLASLVLHLPSALLEFKLNFAFCPGISKAGVKQLSDQLPDNLKTFEATFWGSGTESKQVTFKSLKDLRKSSL